MSAVKGTACHRLIGKPQRVAEDGRLEAGMNPEEEYVGMKTEHEDGMSRLTTWLRRACYWLIPELKSVQASTVESSFRGQNADTTRYRTFSNRSLGEESTLSFSSRAPREAAVLSKIGTLESKARSSCGTPSSESLADGIANDTPSGQLHGTEARAQASAYAQSANAQDSNSQCGDSPCSDALRSFYELRGVSPPVDGFIMTSPLMQARSTGGDRDRKFQSSDAQPPSLMRQSSLMSRVYYINHQWKSVMAKSLIVLYLAAIFYVKFRESNPWYEFFYYLTLQGWTLELLYFTFSLYLDLLARWFGGPEYISPVSKAAAQALSELVFAVQVVIVVFFWAVVFPEEKDVRSIGWELHCHGIGLLLIVGDYLYRFTGFSLRNHKYVVCFSVAYTGWYAFVVLYLKKKVYPGIDFRSLRSALIFLSGLSTVVLTHKIFYLISNWRWIKEDVKTLIGFSKFLFLRQDSYDTLMRGVPDFSTELFSLGPRAALSPISKTGKGGHATCPQRSLTFPEPEPPSTVLFSPDEAHFKSAGLPLRHRVASSTN